MHRKTFSLIALALGAAAASGSAQARDLDVQWSVTIGSPRVGVVVGTPVHAPPVHAPRVYAPRVYAPRVYAPRVVTQPVLVVPRGGHRVGHGRGWKDADGDGIPNRHDRVHNPRWDVDGDGVPNRRDRHDHNPYRR